MTDSPSVWERPEPPERRALSPLSRERIVRAAVTLADAEGIEAVSLRKVAAVLDAGPMRLYRYIDTKDELLDLMVDAVYDEIPRPTGSSWREVARSFAHGIRDAALRHEWFADLLGSRPRLGPAACAHGEASLAALRAAGLSDIDTMMSTIEVLTVYLTGAVRTEVAKRRAERASGLDQREWQASMAPHILRMFATGDYPILSEMVHDGRHRDAAEVFDLGLGYLLDGIGNSLKS
ncbi:TetR family transcriptional regulator [Kribbella steppae]|uniref:TetR family transcriptional regulator n=1 Tax=Kribbella steppae TaxID=2512223 RepID=A0A4R2HR34_9ACTN|nr:TetR/AcrR family transcriptional regulator [Kribbella steppae]TCO33664.1 TetR family transcriptional regulator [Kribbella steppae]